MNLVYFIRRADGVGPVKIGCSKTPMNRLTMLQLWSPEPLTLLASAPGTFDAEKRVHRHLAQHRLHGEWFEAAPRVLSLLAKVAATGELPETLKLSDKYTHIGTLYRGGATLQEIGDLIGISRERVRQILRASGVPSLGLRPETVRTAIAWREEERVRALASEGASVPDIAIQIGDTPSSVRNVLRKLGISVPRKKRGHDALTMKKAARAATAYAAGEKTSAIAKALGVHQPDVFRLLRIAGVTPNRATCRQALPPVEEIAPLYVAGSSIKQVAEHFGCSANAVRRRLAEVGALRPASESEAIRIERVVAANKRERAA